MASFLYKEDFSKNPEKTEKSEHSTVQRVPKQDNFMVQIQENTDQRNSELDTF